MQITEATSADEPNIIERSKYSYRQLALSIEIKDNNEKLVTVSESKNIKSSPFWEAPNDLEGDLYLPYIAENPDFKLMLRICVDKNLRIAAQKLPSNWIMHVKAGYRPLSVQYAILDEVALQIKQKYPHFTDLDALKHARTYVSDPVIMCPPHCTGAAIDIDVIDSVTGKQIDMGCPPNTDAEIAFTHYHGLTPLQKDNRKKLLVAMLASGFANLAYEWWHFSYGDQYWAAFYGKPYALYDFVKQ